MATFIGPEGNDLKKRLLDLISKSSELKFLVGFFYFSGIQELYEGLKNNPDQKIRVLVGLEVDKTNYGLQELSQNKDLSGRDIKFNFLRSVSESLNSENFDKQEFYEQIRFFIKLLKDDKLIIRKTLRPNHSKLYYFKLEKEQFKDSVFITGSSNLTKAGLLTQEEFNVEIADSGQKEADKYFEELWDESVKITEDDTTKQQLIDLVEHGTLVAEITPFEAFVLVLKSYIDSYDKKDLSEEIIELLEAKGYKPYSYQIDAVEQALTVLDNYGGVIIADVVGLGKSVIASTIAKSLGKRGIVICPPGLIGNEKLKDSGWSKYAEDFELYNWSIFSSGNLEQAQKFIKDRNDIDVVIVDEVHRFRNQDTRDYELLSNICRGKKVIELTATPFNNRPNDILSLIKLFDIPMKSKLILSNDIESRFRHYGYTFRTLAQITKDSKSPAEDKRKSAKAKYVSMFGEGEVDLIKVKERTKVLAKEIRRDVEPVVIRRNRKDLENDPVYSKDIGDLSKLTDPEELFFEMTEEQLGFYDKITDYFDEEGEFQGAIYRPFAYENSTINKDGELNEEENFQFHQQKNLFDFMRRLLVKRFESSFGAFHQSIKNFKRVMEMSLKFAEKSDSFILNRKLMDKIYEWDTEQILEELERFAQEIEDNKDEYPKNYKVYKKDEFNDWKGFLESIKSDIELFKKIENELNSLDLVHNDPKLDRVIKALKDITSKESLDSEPKRKVVVFTEYQDTLAYMKERIEKEFGGRALVIDGVLNNKTLEKINSNFDATYKDQNDDYDIVFATDKLSEGFNLNRAGAIINYDIPWNPVRVIQRVGRINRISKKVFNELFIYNFFPTEKGSEFVKSREIAQQKMFLIHETLGEDSKIFDANEVPTPADMFIRINKNPDDLEDESFYTKARRDYMEIKENNKETIEKLSKYPDRVKVSKKGKENSLSIFLRKGNGFFARYDNYDDEIGPRVNYIEDLYETIKSDKKDLRIDFSGCFWTKYPEVKGFDKEGRKRTTEQDLGVRAVNNLRTLLNKIDKELKPLEQFLKDLLEDQTEYRILGDYTVRRLANLKVENINETVEKLNEIKEEVGERFLECVKDQSKLLETEVVIAIENQK